ncbi:MAG: hypothetical protein ACR2IP_11705 [Solirubrobacteraceae bacterium]
MRPLRPGRVSADLILGCALAAGLALVAFLTAGGVELAPNTWVEMALSAIGATLLGTSVLRTGVGTPAGALPPQTRAADGEASAPRMAFGPAAGSVTLLLLAALAVLTYASISWSAQPATSWLEANRTLSYLAGFAGAFALARLAPGRWPALIGAVAVLATVLSGYSLLAKVLPAALDPGDTIGRVSAPLDYWNATGLMAALGLPACLWAGARPGVGRTLRTLAVPAMSVLLTVLVLSYSRSALIAAIVGVGGWLCLVPLRLRAALVLALGAAGAAVASLWALGSHPFTHDHASLHARTAAGHTFGLVLLLVLGTVTMAGFAAVSASERIAVPARLGRRVGMALLMLLALIPLGGLGALTASERGLTGEVSHIWTTLTSTHSGTGDSPGRLVAAGNTRPLYWSEGLKVGEHALLKGAGALGYATARTRYTNSPLVVQHAHSYLIETFADFGLIGLALSLGLLAAWGLAAARSIGRVPARRPRRSARPLRRDLAGPRAGEAPPGLVVVEPADRRSPERIGLLTLLAVVVVFGLHSAIDWTWFIPGTTLPALICAGWLAGRGPFSRPVPRHLGKRAPAEAPGTWAALVAIAGVTILGVWAIWQPLRSADAGAAASSATSTSAALRAARTAAALDPVSIDPLLELSAIYGASDPTSARRELARATSVQPQNPQTWRALGQFDLDRHASKDALGELELALRLDLGSAPAIAPLIATARRELAASR